MTPRDEAAVEALARAVCVYDGEEADQLDRILEGKHAWEWLVPSAAFYLAALTAAGFVVLPAAEIAALRAEISALALRCVELVEVKARLAEAEAALKPFVSSEAMAGFWAQSSLAAVVTINTTAGALVRARAALQAAPAAGQDGEAG